MTSSEGAVERLPVVVLGFPRSGASLIGRIFDSHPQVSCPPETNLLGACGRFLRETSGEGPPLGVLSGLALAGMPEDDVIAEVRGLIFSIHARLAQGKPIWMEKSGFDIFYLDQIERLLAGHCRFLCLRRHPLDVIASIKDLVETAGHYMPELHDHLRLHASPYDAFAAAWLDRNEALDRFAERHGDRCHVVRYEDLTADPLGILARVAGFVGVSAPSPDQIEEALSRPQRIGLGDWKVFTRTGIDEASVGRWRRDLPPGAAARLVERLGPAIEMYGYPASRRTRRPDRQTVLRQFELAKRMQLSARSKP